MMPSPPHAKPGSDPLPGIPTQSRSHLIGALALGFALLVLLFVFSDARTLWQTASALDPWLSLIPVGCALVSYVLMALSYQGIADAAGVHVPFWEMLKITFVANTANYVVSTGGLSGFAIRLYFFLRLSIPSGTAVIISLVQGFLTNVVLLIFVVVGFAYLLAAHNLHGYALGAMAMMLCLFTLAAGVALLLLLHRTLRRRTLFILAETVHWFMHRFFPRHKPGRVHVWRFQRNLNRGIEFLLRRKAKMVVPTLWIVADWLFTLFILYGAFIAVHHRVPMTFVIVGFAVGIVLSLVSFVPGGLGVMEGSMAAIFVSLAVPFETAVIAVLIFRIAYYVLPMVVSVFFFRRMLVQGTHALPHMSRYPT
ncbi:MAG: flippase-like domain-containing protein [Candidatus Binatia bacterium]